MSDLALWIKTQRSKRGMTQAELGKKLDTTQATISQWENGKQQPSPVDYERLKAILADEQAETPGLAPVEPKKRGRPAGSTNKPRDPGSPPKRVAKQASFLNPKDDEGDDVSGDGPTDEPTTPQDDMTRETTNGATQDTTLGASPPKVATPRRRAVKKSDLYSSIWASCDALRGGMDASLYKNYVLFMLFLKYISDKYANPHNYNPIIVPEGASFAAMAAMKSERNIFDASPPDAEPSATKPAPPKPVSIGDRINKRIIQPLIDANPDLARVAFPDFNDEKMLGEGPEMVDRISNLIAIFERPELDFSANQADGDDLLGDAYEYLMRHFATESGKSKGQFYTPAEVSRVIAKLLEPSELNAKGEPREVYDPTCGSGSLLLRVAAEAGKDVILSGQEKDVSTAGLARMNMVLHGFPTANIEQGNTLTSPKFTDAPERLKTFDYVVANPPFSDKAWTTGLDLEDDKGIPKPDKFQRFHWGTPPKKQGDYAYLLHILRSMKHDGKGACILPHGVLFRGNAEYTIRRGLVESGILKAVIGLPPNLFYGTGIPACILVLDKENAATRAGIFMVDASKGFMKDGPKNRLRERDIHQLVDTFKQRKETPRYSRMVPLDEIQDPKNDYNLNLPRYIDTSDPEDLQDLEAHMRGGIPARDVDALAAYWGVMPDLRAVLFGGDLRPGYLALKLPLADLKPTILAHPQFGAFCERTLATFSAWKARHEPSMRALGPDTNPKTFLADLAEDLLDTFRALPLLDAYELYQRLTEFWDSALQDDVYAIKAEGWSATPARITERDKKGKDKDKGWACDLVPKPLVVARYFSAQQAALDAKQAELDAKQAELAELEDEHAAEDAAFGALDKINSKEVKNRLRDLKDDPDAQDEATILQRWLDLTEEESRLKDTIKDLDAKLDRLAYRRYATLTEAEVQQLVIHDKWFAHLEQAVHAELDRATQTLTTRLRDLAERYATPLPELEQETARLSALVAQHLKQMGVSWN